MSTRLNPIESSPDHCKKNQPSQKAYGAPRPNVSITIPLLTVKQAMSITNRNIKVLYVTETVS